MKKLFLVGAGPGDPTLITVKGLNILREADVVLYDALVAEALLYENPAALKIFVGKRCGSHSYTQDQINALILKMCKDHQRVVRLKGGDPIVFGRGHEEAEYALSHGIEVEIIPGVSSSIAGPISEDIPLTKRGISESFWVITGTTRAGKFSADMIQAATSSATVVILMGIRKLPEIVDLFLQHRAAEEPICLLESCTTTAQKAVVGCLGNILALNHAAPVNSPAMIIIGKVVKEKEKISLLKQKLKEQKALNYALQPSC